MISILLKIVTRACLASGQNNCMPRKDRYTTDVAYTVPHVAILVWTASPVLVSCISSQ